MSDARTPLTVAVTGATGFIGRHLTAHLVAQGVTVRSILRPDSPHEAPPGTVAARVPLDTDALVPIFTGAAVVVHMAGVVQPTRASASVNVLGARAVAEAARQAGAHLIHISSLAAAGPAPASAPRTETDPPNPITLYGRSKLAGERAVMGVQGLEWTIFRPGAVYGPGDRAMLPLFRLVHGRVMPVVGRQGASFVFVHVSDVVAAIAAGISRPRPGETFFVGHPRPVSARELLDALRRSQAIGRCSSRCLPRSRGSRPTPAR